MAEFKQQATVTNPQGTELPKGAATQLNEAAAIIEEDTEEDLDLGEEFAPDEFDFEEEEGPAVTGDLAALFAPSDRQEEPLTAGMPQGPGAPETPRAAEGPRAFLRRVASRMAASPSASSEVKDWAFRVAEGQ